jgi:uncharacterized membrane protein YuzA (DUF378 family)
MSSIYNLVAYLLIFIAGCYIFYFFAKEDFVKYKKYNRSIKEYRKKKNIF